MKVQTADAGDGKCRPFQDPGTNHDTQIRSQAPEDLGGDCTVEVVYTKDRNPMQHAELIKGQGLTGKRRGEQRGNL